MSKREQIRDAMIALYNEGAELTKDFQHKKEQNFHYQYQHWYTDALRAVTSLAPERLEDFKKYYEADPKRKHLGYGTYAIQDYLRGVAPSGYHYQDFDVRDQTLKCLFNQVTIFKAILERIDSVLANIEGELFAELEDDGVATARELAKINLRAAGALMGVIIEGHLQKVADAHSIKLTKKNPTIADLIEPLKAASVINLPTWRKITYLADIRNLCSHRKDVDPTKDQVAELISGGEWVTKNVF